MQLLMRRSALMIVCAAILLSSCNGDDGSLADYAANLDSYASALGEELAAGDARMTTGNPSLEDAREVLASALVARKAFQEDLEALDPPEAVTDLHHDLVAVHGRIIAAHEAFAARANGATSLEQVDQSDEALAYRAMVAESVTICQEFLDRIDATGEGEKFEDVPWVPGDLKEVVEVTFGC